LLAVVVVGALVRVPRPLKVRAAPGTPGAPVRVAALARRVRVAAWA
jgi:hypothetical protein